MENLRDVPDSALFDLEEVFELKDYLFTYGDELSDQRAEAEVESLIRVLGICPGMSVLDLACGFGRHANRLAQRGCNVTGIDLIHGFLEIARLRAPAVGVTYIQGDMRQLEFHAAFDRAMMLFTSFGYFEDAENENVLARMARALKPGGRLLIDLINRDVLLKSMPPSEVIEKGTDLVVNRYCFDVLTGRFHNGRILIRNGARKDKPYSIRLYTPNEVSRMAESCGLVDCRFLDERGQPVTAGSRRIQVLATRP